MQVALVLSHTCTVAFSNIGATVTDQTEDSPTLPLNLHWRDRTTCEACRTVASEWVSDEVCASLSRRDVVQSDVILLDMITHEAKSQINVLGSRRVIAFCRNANCRFVVNHHRDSRLQLKLHF